MVPFLQLQGQIIFVTYKKQSCDCCSFVANIDASEIEEHFRHPSGPPDETVEREERQNRDEHDVASIQRTRAGLGISVDSLRAIRRVNARAVGINSGTVGVCALGATSVAGYM